ncbi:thioesterase-like superfamily-domain-containing protein [Rhodofomes roseus]|uniref:Thioesterase-like superfamily-domain-containing protein n=1 Tax=Rhodofomes roseus TaxID=34475 RepID=A0ABQ8KRX2_9APHY|nr:thioesterase-like superfamily-domain-containing protein [Rhodofomes roseus]KAH9841034.1 thioesterase-like superfamily-domain-containing protein [Rhodofomes roseus]
MAPLSVAVQPVLEEGIPGGHHCYTGIVDTEWGYENFPHGGYIIALICTAATKARQHTDRLDIIHASTHFISATKGGPYKIYVETIREGKSFHNVSAKFCQDGAPKVVTHLIFGVLPLHPLFGGKADPQTLAIPDPLARRIPLSVHPGELSEDREISQAQFKNRMRWAFDPAPLEYNRERYLEGESAEPDKESPGGGEVRWGCWFDFVDEDQKLDLPAICFLSDLFVRVPDLLPAAKQDGTWSMYSYTTLVLNVEFKCKFPYENPPKVYAPRSVGLYSTSRFMHGGLFDDRVEVWTAPAAIAEEDNMDRNWREEQVCLVAANQISVAHPLGLKGKGSRKSQKPVHKL